MIAASVDIKGKDLLTLAEYSPETIKELVHKAK